MATLSISSQTSLLDPANFLVFALYDTSAPSVLLEKIAPPKPYGNPLQVTFTYNCLNGHVYLFKLWESADDTATGAVRNSTNVTVSGNTVDVRLDEYWEADVTTDFVSGVNTFEKADIENWYLSIERLGMGTMPPQSATDIMEPMYKRTNSDDSPNDLGPKITLLGDGVNFQPNEKFCVRFTPQVSIAPPAGTPSAWFGTGRIITAGETLTSADVGQALQIQGGTSNITVGLMAISSIPDFSFVYLLSVGGIHINAIIPAQGSDKILYPTDLASVTLGQCESAILYKAFGKWNLANDLTGFKQCGELLYNYGRVELNTLLCTGQLVNRADYPRLWAFVSGLESGVVVTDAAWTGTTTVVDGITYYTKKGCFSTGNGSTTFRLPLLTNSFLRGVDGSVRVPGPLELQSVGKHNHFIANTHSDTTNTPPSASNYMNYQGELNGNFKYSLRGSADLPTFLKTSDGGSTETKPTNIGAYLLIRI